VYSEVFLNFLLDAVNPHISRFRTLDLRFAARIVLESHASQVLWLKLLRVNPVEQDRLISNNTGRSIKGCRLNSPNIRLDTSAYHEESVRLVQVVDQLTAIYCEERDSFDGGIVQQFDIGHLNVAGSDKRWDCDPQVQQGMQLDRSLRLVKRCTNEQAQHQIDCCSIKRVDEFPGVESEHAHDTVELAHVRFAKRKTP
jgi:hypothetical protein